MFIHHEFGRDEPTNRRTDKQTNRRTDEPTNRRTDEQTNRRTREQLTIIYSRMVSGATCSECCGVVLSWCCGGAKEDENDRGTTNTLGVVIQDRQDRQERPRQTMTDHDRLRKTSTPRCSGSMVMCDTRTVVVRPVVVPETTTASDQKGASLLHTPSDVRQCLLSAPAFYSRKFYFFCGPRQFGARTIGTSPQRTLVVAEDLVKPISCAFLEGAV